MSDLKKAKALLRAELAAELKARTKEDRVLCSRRACQRLEGTALWQQARCILAYAPRADELDISLLVEGALLTGKQVALPQFDAQTGSYRACQISGPIASLAPGRFGIPEPCKDSPGLMLNQLDLVLVPGVAFDLTGRRLGRGRGYYDQLLTNLRAIKCGLGFDQQVKAHIPVEPHDILLDCMLTPDRWLDFRPHRPGDDSVG